MDNSYQEVLSARDAEQQDVFAQTEQASSSAIITIVRDPNHNLGKRFDINPDGTISKQSAVNLSFGIAVQHHVPTHEDLAKLLDEVGNDPHAAIINASFNDIPIGEEFIILSEKEIEERLGIPRKERDHQKGVHQLEYQGKDYKGVGRFKENVSPSNWQLWDRDVDSHTPVQFAGLLIDEWLHECSAIFPGLDQVSYVVTPSASSRVLREGQAVGSGNGHVWVFVAMADDMERVRNAALPLAWQVDMAWLKPRHSKSEPGKVVGHGQATLVDQSVWTPGRLVFDGKPVAGEGLTVIPQQAQVVHRAKMMLDTSAMVTPDRKVSVVTQFDVLFFTNGDGWRR